MEQTIENKPNLIPFLVNGLLFLSLFLCSCGPDLPDKVSTAYDQLPIELDFN